MKLTCCVVFSVATDRIVESEYKRKPFIYGKDLLVEPLDPNLRIDISARQTESVLKFKQNKRFAHNK